MVITREFDDNEFLMMCTRKGTVKRIPLLAAVMFFWVCKKDYVLEQVNLARSKPLGCWFYPMAKYVLCFVTVLVLILGAANGGIG